MRALLFDEIRYDNKTYQYNSTEQWVLSGFNDTNQLVPANDYKLPASLIKTTFNVSDSNPLLKTSNLVNTKTTIVGFATTTDSNLMIKSVQPIYYTNNQAICSSLAPKPTKNALTKVSAEPFVITDFAERILLDSDFQLLFLKWAIAILSVFVFIVTVIFICFCTMSYRPSAITI